MARSRCACSRSELVVAGAWPRGAAERLVGGRRPPAGGGWWTRWCPPPRVAPVAPEREPSAPRRRLVLDRSPRGRGRADVGAAGRAAAATRASLGLRLAEAQPLLGARPPPRGPTRTTAARSRTARRVHRHAGARGRQPLAHRLGGPVDRAADDPLGRLHLGRPARPGRDSASASSGGSVDRSSRRTSASFAVVQRRPSSSSASCCARTSGRGSRLEVQPGPVARAAQPGGPRRRTLPGGSGEPGQRLATSSSSKIVSRRSATIAVGSDQHEARLEGEPELVDDGRLGVDLLVRGARRPRRGGSGPRVVGGDAEQHVEHRTADGDLAERRGGHEQRDGLGRRPARRPP